ncbi:hypothetical protein BDV26DRAFT_264042 [Aspergillus bertholletiae]|uniref:Uncharacterized protein n=1 Tax=Aspergillus bertholletiae TaxID=1226010 RepID=A0A5N7B590_9EURO|nr:hypothetical protein BDV26DRAFT_264042 [Aspergillus bertholletiae]
MIFHKPALHRLLYKTATNSNYIDRASDAVVFAVYYATVTSMNLEQCAEELTLEYQRLGSIPRINCTTQ